MTEELNFKAICNLTTNVMGLPEGSLSFNNRTRNIQAARSVAGYIGLKEENIDRKIIAKILKRDRTATYHYENTHHKNFKHCIVYRNTFTKVYKKYKDIDEKKDVFITSKQMKNHLLQNKVYESRNSDVKLQITSGEVKCIIYTSYFDFSNQIENVKLAMKNYHYTVNII
tara:strand:- start:152 stop:661 length:510 start_codon:yes stop_codon:yes gene_type:complete